MRDVVIRNGLVVDGTGAPGRVADVSIEDGKIVEVGSVDAKARRTVDAEGRVVAPGFIDIHTHLDAQAFWDQTLSPSPLHGVTTVVGGNCGFSIAPLAPETADYIMTMLARVEAMPLSSLENGVPWDWDSTGQYLDRLDGTLAVNAGFMVGHSTIRHMVMGEAATERTATQEEIEAMSRLLRRGLGVGALGFSSSWAESHSDGDGRAVPSRCAPVEEMCALSAVAGEFAGTSIEFVPGTGMTPTGRRFSDEQVEALVSMSVAAKRPVNWNLVVVTADTIDEARGLLAAGDVARSRGGKVVGLVMPEALPSRYNFRTGFVLDLVPSIHDFFFLPVEERKAILSNPERRAEFRLAAEQPSNFSHIVDWKTRYITETFTPETAKYAGRIVGDIAAEESRDPFDVLIDIVLADDLRTTLSSPLRTSTLSDWKARAEIFGDRNAVVGGSDAGAHVDAITQFAYPTRLLEHGVREHGVITVEEAVRLMTSVPADLYGFHERGRLAPGRAADVVVFDLDTVGLGPITTEFDLPGGAGRLYAAAEGYDHVLVNGVEIATHGEFTGERPGRIMRRGSDTVTPALV